MIDKLNTEELGKMSSGQLGEYVEKVSGELRTARAQAASHEAVLASLLAEQNNRLAAYAADIDPRVLEGTKGAPMPGRCVPAAAPVNPTPGSSRRSGRSGPHERGRRRRAVNPIPLPDALKKVLTGKTMSVQGAADAVQADGYKTYSSNFKIMVNMVLTKYPKMFKRVARGRYTAHAAK